MVIGVIDYGCGNLKSVLNALHAVGAEAKLVLTPDSLCDYDKLILPGVGSFPEAMKAIHAGQWLEPLNERVMETKVPCLGICLGMQLMCLDSDEGTEDGMTQGLGWIDAHVRRFETAGLKVPHMGWNQLDWAQENTLFDGLERQSDVYFVHSHAAKCNNEDHRLATTPYGFDFDSIVGNGHIIGMQFHPEKSHRVGLKLLSNFVGANSC